MRIALMSAALSLVSVCFAVTGMIRYVLGDLAIAYSHVQIALLALIAAHVVEGKK